MSRIVLPSLLVLAGLAGWAIYSFCYQPAPDLAQAPVLTPDDAPLPQADEFEVLARTDPVKMLEKCLVRYQREVKNGFTANLSKQELVKGKLLPREEIALAVRGDVPDPSTGKTKIEVLMKWISGGHVELGTEVKGTLYVEEKGGTLDSIITWRPNAPFRKEHAIDVNGPSARGASRYCIRDAGFYRVTMRTYEAWRQRKEADTLQTEYLGRKRIEETGVDCYVVKRICKTPDVDAFELGGTAPTDPEVIARDGFGEITVMIDAQRWLQVGTELRKANGELVGAYYFRNVDLNPSFSAKYFSRESLKSIK